MIKKISTLERKYIILLGITLATIPCYCVGVLLLLNQNLTDEVQPTETIGITAVISPSPMEKTSTPAGLQTPILTPTITQTFTATITYQIPPSETPTPTLTPTSTETPTNTPTPMETNT